MLTVRYRDRSTPDWSRAAALSAPGRPPAMTALLSGEVQVMIEAVPSALPHVRGGRLRALAVTAPDRWPALPDLPTVAESGLPGFDAGIWWGVLGPARIPPPIIATLNTQVLAALQDADLRRRLEEAGFSLIGNSPEAAKRMIATETVKWKKVVTATGFKGD